MDIIRIKQGVIRNLEIELQQFKEKIAKQDHLIDQLEKARQATGEEASASTRKYLKVNCHPSICFSLENATSIHCY